MKNLSFFIIIFSAALLSSCEKVIDLQLRDAEPVLMIEGTISNLQEWQEVNLSHTVPFDSELRRMPVTGARVFLREGNNAWKALSEFQDGQYIIRDFRGRPGVEYSLRVEYDDETYESTSRMPEVVRIDSTGVSVMTFDETRRTPLVLFQDPPAEKNYYYFEVEVNGDIVPSLFLYNDKFNNGKYVTINLDDFELNLNPLDSVVVELRNIDEGSYNFWKGVQSQTATSASPGNPPSNISNGALGYFSAYAGNSVYFIME